nr:serine/threonine protein kinase [Gemmatimonadota bacterium]
MARLSRASRSSLNPVSLHTLEHDALAVRLQEALGTRVLLVRVIGEGGMGRVYLARDPQLRRFVAVKVLLLTPGAEGEAHARFQREAQSIAAVSHANVVAIHGVGELPDGTPYFIMQHVAGGSMADRLATSGTLPIELAERVLGDVAAGLAAAHRRGIVHRDVKPANVLWDEEGERATVSDFGIAALHRPDGDEGDMRITGSGMSVGSPTYMSPEQLLAEPVTPKSDIYALGLLGYELLTGHGPYLARAPNEIVAAHLRHVPRKITELRPDVPPDLDMLLLRCLAKDPAERPTADEVTLALTPGAADALEWPPPGLERARAALWRMILMPMLGSLLLLMPLIAVVNLDSAGLVDVTNSWPLLLGLSSFLGFAAFVRGGMRLWRLRGPLSRAARLGYGWGTLLEVMADRRGDTGSLIAGTREYAELTAGARAALRMLRVVQAALLALAAPLALVASVVSLGMRGGEHGGERTLLAFVTWTLVGLAGTGIACGLYERARLSSIRYKRALRPRHTSEMELAPAWLAAFERSRTGQWFGSGMPVRRIVTLAGGLVGVLVILLSAGILLTVNAITVTGRVVSSNEFPGSYLWTAYQSQRHTGAERYRLAPNGTTTPIEAGEALITLASTGRPRKPSSIEKRQSVDYPTWRRVTPSPALFPRPSELPWTSAAILAAAKGLSAEQRDVLT